MPIDDSVYGRVAHDVVLRLTLCLVRAGAITPSAVENMLDGLRDASIAESNAAYRHVMHRFAGRLQDALDRSPPGPDPESDG